MSELSGVTYAGMSEYVGCHECSPECPDDFAAATASASFAPASDAAAA